MCRHTSVVVFGREIFYGQGILETHPGQSHHGKPLHVIDIGETALDEETFNEYLLEISKHFTADKVCTAILEFLRQILSLELVSSAWYVVRHLVSNCCSSVRADFNCNSFTNDVIGFLTGGSIPSWIKGTHMLPLSRQTRTDVRIQIYPPISCLRHLARHCDPRSTTCSAVLFLVLRRLQQRCSPHQLQPRPQPMLRRTQRLLHPFSKQ